MLRIPLAGRLSLLLLLTLAPFLAVHAQAPRVVTDDPWCEERDNDDRREVYCEVREYALPARDALTVDAGTFGGIEVEAWDRNEVRLRARVQGNARTERDARRLVADTEIETGRTIRPDAPEASRDAWVGVSFELMVPRRTDLDLTANHGGIAIEGVEGRIAFEALNGGVSLDGVGGDVRGETTNGGLNVVLSGDAWAGRGLDVATVNGGVRLVIPEGYSAELETGTVNGRVRLDFPVAVQGEVGDRLVTTLGRGGPRVRAVTTNGSVVLSHN
jgi:hypothetical protein